MADDILSQLLRLKKWISGHKSIAAALLAVVMTGSAFGGAMAFEHNQNVHIGALTADISVAQSVYFNGTNANLNPITYGGVNYSTSTPLYTQIGSTITSHGPQSVTASFDFGNFEPGDYISMTVNLTNTGHAVLLLNSTGVNVSLSAETLYANGSSPVAYNGTNTTGIITNPPLLTYIFPLAEVFATPANNASIIEGYLSDGTVGNGFHNPYTGQAYSDSQIWIAGFSAVNNTPIPQYLEPGNTFSYTLWIGLGTNATLMYGTTTTLSVSVPMIPSR